LIDLPRPVVVLTGAGISAESGIPTFRGAGGLWRSHRATDLAAPQAFRSDPKLVWEFYGWRRELISARQPNVAHTTLGVMEQTLADFTLITQNVDGLHQRAGNLNVLTLHGDIWRVRCTACTYSAVDTRVPLPELPPRCPTCGGLLRPDVVWFGEQLSQRVVEQAWMAAGRAGLMLVVGTSALVQPAASLPMVAQRNGAVLVEINPEQTPLTPLADIHLHGSAGEHLPQWWQSVQQRLVGIHGS
jgi:NAD-dependent deacetylase